MGPILATPTSDLDSVAAAAERHICAAAVDTIDKIGRTTAFEPPFGQATEGRKRAPGKVSSLLLCEVSKPEVRLG